MKLNEYGIFEYSKNGHSLGALFGAEPERRAIGPLTSTLNRIFNGYFIWPVT